MYNFRFFGEKILKFIEEASQNYEEKIYLEKKDLEYILKKSIEFLSIPYPNNTILKYFYEPEIVALFLRTLINNSSDKTELRKRIIEKAEPIFKKLEMAKSGPSIIYRILGEKGVYPDCNLVKDHCTYEITNFLPTLTTLSVDYFSEVRRDINENELKVATCVMLASKRGAGSFFFTNHNKIEIREKTLKKVPLELHNYFLYELLQFKNRFITSSEIYPEETTLTNVSKYNFSPFTQLRNTYYKLFDAYDTADNVLLKTSDYFLKAHMLWTNSNFGEEAITNIFFCLEGCLHLIQKRKCKIEHPQLDLEKVKKIFRKEIPNGENIFDFIKEGYYKRIELVHPEPAEPDWEAEWPVDLEADDFYEYSDICNLLLNFILINRVFKLNEI